MKTEAAPLENVEIIPVTPRRWADMQVLFGPRGACAGCWCMYWRLKRAEFQRQTGDGNRLAMQALIQAGEIPGLLAYLPEKHAGPANQPVGWVSVAPRQAFPLFERSRVLKPVDDAPVWSVVCFFVARRFRDHGLTLLLLRAAVDFAAQHGAAIVEGYPIEPKKGRTADVFVYTGLASTFLQAGFVEVARRSETRPIMRYYIK